MVFSYIKNKNLKETKICLFFSLKHVYTTDELFKEMEILRQTFHTVRLVSPEECLVYQLDENGLSKDARCYKLWGRSHPLSLSPNTFN